MITHEVNNPLDGAMRLINLSLVKLKEEDGPVKEYLGEAKKGLNRIASLVSSLLSFSRKSASLDAGFAPLNTVIDNAVTTIRNRKHCKSIPIDLKLAPENPTVKTNDFDQIISNLLSNSCDAVSNGVPSGRRSILVETKLENGYLHIIVGDNGCGIPKRIQSQIFKAFCTTKEYGEGTGLGLAIVKKMIDKYEGTIKVESEENVGTEMRLTFPVSNLAPECMELSRDNER
jgi:signal transduction histidine kinase